MRLLKFRTPGVLPPLPPVPVVVLPAPAAPDVPQAWTFGSQRGSPGFVPQAVAPSAVTPRTVHSREHKSHRMSFILTLPMSQTAQVLHVLVRVSVLPVVQNS